MCNKLITNVKIDCEHVVLWHPWTPHPALFLNAQEITHYFKRCLTDSQERMTETKLYRTSGPDWPYWQVAAVIYFYEFKMSKMFYLIICHSCDLYSSFECRAETAHSPPCPLIWTGIMPVYWAWNMWGGGRAGSQTQMRNQIWIRHGTFSCLTG